MYIFVSCFKCVHDPVSKSTIVVRETDVNFF